MHVEFIADTSALAAAAGIDADALQRFAAVTEASGYDRVSIATDGHDATGLASYMLHSTSRLGVLAAHEAGLFAPEVAARQIATLDRLSRGRLAVGVAVGDTGSQGHEHQLERLDEYLVLLKRLWSNDKPFDHEGKFYRVAGAFVAAKPHAGSHVPISMSGLSGTAIKVAARHADIFALPPSTIKETRLTVERVRAACASHRRADAIRFSYPFRPVVAPTKTAAWAKAEQSERSHSAGADRAANAALIAGTPGQVASAILDYHTIGISHFVLQGFGAPEEAALFGRDVIPLVRNALQHRLATVEECAPVVRVPPLRDLPWRRYQA